MKKFIEMVLFYILAIVITLAYKELVLPVMFMVSVHFIFSAFDNE